MKLSLTRTAVAIGMAGAVVALSPSVQAADTYTIALNCSQSTTIYGAVGDTFIFSMGNGCTATPTWELSNQSGRYSNPGGLLRFVSRTQAGIDSSPLTANPILDWYVYSDDSGLTTITTTLMASTTHYRPIGDPLLLTEGLQVAEVDQDSVLSVLPIIWGGLVAPQSVPGTEDSNESPLPIVQAVGMPVSGECDSIDDRALNWAAVKAGGWNPSWQQWANDGNGGQVCQRTLTYSQGQWHS